MSNVSLIDGHIDETAIQNDMIDRLIEMLEEAEGQVNNDVPSLEIIADYLIANGVVPVIRCKYCKHYNEASCANGFGWCERFNYGQTDEHFCSYGEMK